MGSELQICLLGGFQARIDDRRVTLASKKAQALIAYLAVERDRPQARETLAELLWGDTREERSRHNLRQTISNIRRIHESLIETDGQDIRLDLRICEIDVVEFEQLAGNDDAPALRRALDLYRGDLLHGVNPREPAYEEWLRLARVRYRKLACATARQLADRYQEADSLDDAAAALNDLLAVDPADERAHRELMTVLEKLGRRSDALRQYQLCREALEHELGALPDRKTQALFASMQQSDAGATEATLAAEHTAPTRGPAIAVLPFDNLCSDADRYFVDGIVEDLITALSGSHSLVVIARGSSFRYRSDAEDSKISEELGARYLVRGSVQRAANQVRINVRLLDAKTGLNIWGHRFDRELEDVFLLQDEITSTLVSSLPGKIEAAQLAHARKAPPERLDAYDLLLRGKELHHRFTAEDCAGCIEMFRKAIDRDPSYALAYAWLACGLGQAIVFGLDEIPKLVDSSEDAARKGLALDENDAECHRILAQVSLTRGNLRRALWHQDRALALNANDDRIVCSQGEILAYAGDAKTAETWVRRSMRLNPFHPPRYWTHLARALFHQGRYEETLEALELVGQARTDDYAYRIAAHSYLGNTEAAAQSAAELRTRNPGFDADDFVTAMPYENESYRDELARPLVASL
ncbi:MAG: BTAD domain-containing putative transcriptional regulator [Gammaproteobacteria bacterium]